MEKREAGLIVARELAERRLVHIVYDTKVEEWLKQTADYSAPVIIEKGSILGHCEIEWWIGNEPLPNDFHFKILPSNEKFGPLPRTEKRSLKQEFLRENSEKMILEAAKGVGANYIFVINTKDNEEDDKNRGNISFQIEGTPYAVIGEDEIIELKTILLGNFNSQLGNAVKTLGLEDKLKVDFCELYEKEGETFQKLFAKISNQKREEVLNEILAKKKQNLIVDAWLEINFGSLIDKVGMERCYSEE